MSTAKLPPFSLEAEQAVLGGLMLDNQAWDTVADRVFVEDFYRDDHRLIFSAIHALSEENKPCDAVTLSEWLKSRGQLEDAGGLAYLGTLANETPSAANIRAYADIVRERSVLRQLIRTGTEIADLGFTPEGRTASDLLNDAEARIFSIAEQSQRTARGFQPVDSMLKEIVDHVDKLFHSEDALTGLPTGLGKFDYLTSGLQKGDLIIIAARPSMGKTSLATNIVERVSILTDQSKRVPTAIFSMEMSAVQLTLRMISSLGRIDQQHLRTGKLEDQEWPRFRPAITLLHEAPIYIDDSSALSPTEMLSRARRLKREKGIGLVVVDYLQLMSVPGTRENRTTEVSEISRSLKAMAKELKVPVIALSQLSRAVVQRGENARPRMSDLRESGAIEQDADLVVFIHREDYENQASDRQGVAEIIIAKQRNGPTGTCEVAFLRQHTKFENLADESYADAHYETVTAR
jgi:replicative DNA helicase